jgi:DNA-3-methyladenine glycosylase II
LKTRPTPKEMGPLAESWRPWRGAAACMLWSYYRIAKQRDGAPVEAAIATPTPKRRTTTRTTTKRRSNG